MRHRPTPFRAAMWLGLALGLAACGGGPADTGLRRSDAQISSAAAFDPARFADVWHVVAAYGGEAGCGPLTETWQPIGPGRFQVTGTACGKAGSRAFAAEAEVIGPGRFRRDLPSGREEIWVLWTDADYRVAVLGNPAGGFGRVLARTPGLRGDLMQAARDVLRFNGYDPAALRPL